MAGLSPLRMPLRAAGLAGSASQRIALGLAVQVIEPGLTHGVDVGGYHRNLLSGAA